jgi:hypothetical protein
MIEIFKTNVNDKKRALRLCRLLLSVYPDSRVNIDLEDVDKVLRIETPDKNIDVCRIIMIFEDNDHACEILNG